MTQIYYCKTCGFKNETDKEYDRPMKCRRCNANHLVLEKPKK